MIVLSNNELTIEVKEQGAELVRISDNQTKKEYLWNGDPKYWGRTSPILFPFVGGLVDKKYSYQEKVYSMGQHGFARDMNFTLLEQKENKACFSLTATKETRAIYPFDFALEIGYELKQRNIIVSWKVINKESGDLYFSIGGHPAFYCPLDKEGKQTDCYIGFDTKLPLKITQINENGLVYGNSDTLITQDGLLQITEHMFDNDALVIEHNQAHRVFLAGKDKRPYLWVEFDAPLFGIWTPAKKNAPFICIEPWYGRCDRADFHGKLEEREWGNQLKENEVFEKSYTIGIEKI